MSIGHLTGEDGATGTSDVIIIDYDQEAIEVIDLKYGMGVKVHAEDNEQMQMYALGALHEHSLISDFSWATMVIHQPRLNHVSEWHITTAQLEQFCYKVRDAATITRNAEDEADAEYFADQYLTPGEKQCRFCKAKATCPALRDEVSSTSGPATAADFADFVPAVLNVETGDNYLSMAMSKVDLVEAWCKSVRAETERRLKAGQTVEGWKLVEGRMGVRAWSDPAAAEEMFKKSFRLRDAEMYVQKLISPTAAEKLLKGTPKRWKRAEGLIQRSAGKPSVAPAADKRPAIAANVTTAEDFAGLVTEGN